MLIIGSHVSFTKDKQLLGSLEEALLYGANTFMFYTGAPQNTNRMAINDELTNLAYEKMKQNNIDLNHLVVHAPYIINLANDEKMDFSIRFLKEECKRCEALGVKRLVLHPGSHVGLGVEKGISNIVFSLNEVLRDTSVTILLETMAGKGTEIGKTPDELQSIISKIEKQDQIGVCLDTCHLFDAGYDISDFDGFLDLFDEKIGISKILCVHINDSKNIISSHKDRHANFGYGNIGFDNLLKVVYNSKIENIPKILETPYIGEYAPYKEEINMIKTKTFNPNLEKTLKKEI